MVLSLLRVGGEGEEKEDVRETEAPEVPEEFIDHLAQRMFNKYGDALARMVNERIVPRLNRLEKQISDFERRLKKLEAVEDNKILELIKTVLQIHSEALVDSAVNKTAERVVGDLQDKIAVDKVLSIADMLESFSEKFMVFEENLEKLQDAVSKLEKTYLSSQRDTANVLREIENIKEGLNEVVEEFKSSVVDATKEAAEIIKKNVTVDATIIKQAVEGAVSQVVSTEMSEILNSVNEVRSGVQEEISSLKSELGRVFNFFEEILEKLDEIKESAKSVEDMTGITD